MLETEDHIRKGVEKRKSEEKKNWNTVYKGSWVTEKFPKEVYCTETLESTTP